MQDEKLLEVLGGMINTSTDMWLGTRAADDFHFAGDFSENAVWTNILTAQEVLDYYNLTKDRPPRD